MFGRRKKRSAESEVTDTENGFEYANDEDDAFDDIDEAAETSEGAAEAGPYDIADVEERLAAVIDQRLDLGSVVLPVPEGAQLQVEMGQDGTPQGVHLTTPHGRITVAAYAAPKSPGQWREVVSDLADSLRNDNATVTIETGEWGREVVASTPAADLRFIGVDGYRWMVRLVAAGPAGSVVADAPLVGMARAILRDTVVRRGTEPHPVRTPLPVVLPRQLAEQLTAAYNQQLAQMAAAQAAQTQGAPPAQPAPQPAEPAATAEPAPSAEPAPPTEAAPQPRQRRGAAGSAMQQLGRRPGETGR